MNKELRERSKAAELSLLEFILKRFDELEKETGIRRTLLAACPNSIAVIKEALLSAKRCNAPVKFAATLNQVDRDGGYTGFTAKEFVNTIREEAGMINFTGPVIIAIDHGGPWLKDRHRLENLSYNETMAEVKNSFEKAMDAGFDMIHVDPTIDITLPPEVSINIDIVAQRTLELIVHCENYRKKKRYERIAYEVGTEEVHGGLADMKIFNRFLVLLQEGLKKEKLMDVWPCFVVGKVGTDLHTTLFDATVASQLTEAARPYGTKIKGHYSDNVDNPEDYPRSGMGAANVGPEFTEREYDGLMELVSIENSLFEAGKISNPSRMKDRLWEAVIASGRWKKWVHENESKENFWSLKPERQQWLIKTGCRYIWENLEVLAARALLYKNMEINHYKPEIIVQTRIGQAMDRYFHRFNLVNVNDIL